MIDTALIRQRFDLEPDHAGHHGVEISPYRQSLGRRLFRTVAYGFIVIVIGGAALAWYSSDDNAEGMVSASLRQLSSAIGIKSAASPDVQPISNTSAQASVAVGSSAELQHQLEMVVNDIAVMRTQWSSSLRSRR